MEPNENVGPADTNASGPQSGATEFSGSGTPQGGSFDFAGQADATGKSGEPRREPLRDRARGALGAAGERLGSVGSSIREGAGTAKNRLADVLDSGAGRLRHGGGDGNLAAAAADGSAAIADDGAGQVSDRLAGGMQATAQWLREAELDDLKTGIEKQVREHPGRTLLIAAGLGYLLGRAFRNNQ